MREFGITRREQIPGNLSVTMEKPPHIAISMLGELVAPLRDRDEVAIELICDAMATGDGQIHRRRTFPRRYDVVNQAIIDLAKTELADANPLRVYDVAVSNGISSVEFFEALAKDFNPEMHAMDYLDAIQVVGPFGQWSVVFDNIGRPLQFVGRNFVIPVNGKGSWRHPVNQLLKNWLKRSLLPRALRELGKTDASNCRVQRCDAFHPHAKTLAQRDPRFRIDHGNMYVPVDAHFDLIRVMSVFSNVSDEQVTRAVQALCASLDDGGLLVVGRNPGRHSKEIPTTIFRRQGAELLPVLDLMGGAEQKTTILSVDLQDTKQRLEPSEHGNAD